MKPTIYRTKGDWMLKHGKDVKVRSGQFGQFIEYTLFDPDSVTHGLPAERPFLRCVRTTKIDSFYSHGGNTIAVIDSERVSLRVTYEWLMLSLVDTDLPYHEFYNPTNED